MKRKEREEDPVQGELEENAVVEVFDAASDAANRPIGLDCHSRNSGIVFFTSIIEKCYTKTQRDQKKRRDKDERERRGMKER